MKVSGNSTSEVFGTSKGKFNFGPIRIHSVQMNPKNPSILEMACNFLKGVKTENSGIINTGFPFPFNFWQ